MNLAYEELVWPRTTDEAVLFLRGLLGEEDLGKLRDLPAHALADLGHELEAFIAGQSGCLTPEVLADMGVPETPRRDLHAAHYLLYLLKRDLDRDGA